MNEGKETQEQVEPENEEQEQEETSLYGSAAADVLDTAFDMQELFRQYGMVEERQMVEAEHVSTGLVHAKQAVKVVFEMEADEFLVWWFDQIGEELPKPTDPMSTFTRAFLQKGCEIYLTQRKNAAMNVQIQFAQQMEKERQEKEAAEKEATDDADIDAIIENENKETEDADEFERAAEVEKERIAADIDGKILKVIPNDEETEEVTDVPLDKEEPIETEDESET